MSKNYNKIAILHKDKQIIKNKNLLDNSIILILQKITIILKNLLIFMIK